MPFSSVAKRTSSIDQIRLEKDKAHRQLEEARIRRAQAERLTATLATNKVKNGYAEMIRMALGGK